MKLLSTIHRWTGGFIGLLLAVLGLSGTLLLWKESWISLPGARDPLAADFQTLAGIAERESAHGAIRITFPSDDFGLIQVSREGGAGAYLNQHGETVAAWASQWQRPELWIFDLHHHLFSGETGETVAGIAGIFGLLFVISGIFLWLRSRSPWRPRLLPRQFQPGPIVRHHRDLGILIAPLLLISFTTGTLMVFKPAAAALLSPWGELDARARPPHVAPSSGPAPVAAMLAQARARFPGSAIRRLNAPRDPGQPWSVTMKQPFEWTANGRTRLMFDGAGRLAKVDDPAIGSKAASIYEKFLPIHSAKVGGFAWKLVLTLSGLGLTMLGALATWSFWFRKAKKRRRPDIARAGLEVAAA